ncbi:Bug family tripartite tricarboxylate transporter substrate binding protein [Muricoccus radiodurans]|uniref:Bug family tripartite tricarboxylate transporter substrate binding protein n=1 Tax=Muricoccus radiodurans TaxID=2231721 RepID=UPI003CEBE73D
MNKLCLARRALLAAAGTVVAGRAARAAYPDRPVRWIVGYAPGGGSDSAARLLGTALSARLGQPVVVENRPGAATSIAAEAAARSAPDGYTLLTADNGTLVFNPVLYRRLPYEVDRDFRAVGLFARMDLVLVVKGGSDIRGAEAFIARARSAPSSIDYASPGVGSPHHLAMERLAREAGIRLNHVPYRGAAPALSDLLAGNVEAMMLDVPTGLEHLRGGSAIRPLAAASARRLRILPGTPTLQELGQQGFEAFAWQALLAPAAVPEAVAARLSEEFAAVLRDEAVGERLRAIGIEPNPGGPDAYAALLAAERAAWVPLIRSLGITLDG